MGIEISGFQSTMNALDYEEFGTVEYEVSTETTTYAVFVEYGTSENRAQPFMRPAARRGVRRLDVIVEEADEPEDIARELAEFIHDEARDEAPVDTGRLRDSITIEEI